MIKKFFIFYILSLSVLYSCQNNNEENKNLKSKIDSIDIHRFIYELEVDSLGKTLDTVSIEKIKRNNKGIVIYKEKKIINNEDYYISTEYFRENKNAFYLEKKSAKLGLLMSSDFFEKNGEIITATFFSYKNNRVDDTIRLNYENFYFKNNVKAKTIIKSADVNEKNDFTERNYDSYGNLISEFFIKNGDTINETEYSYSGRMLKGKTLINYQEGTLWSYKYNNDGHLQYEETFDIESDSLVKTKEVVYKTDSEGNITHYLTTTLPDNQKKYFILRYAKK